MSCGIPCTVCGSGGNCGCSGAALTTDPAMCCGNAVASSCQNVVSATPIPFYNCAPSCPESHQQTIITQSFSADVKIADSWNVPLCGEQAIVSAVSLGAIVVGSYLWNPTYGYFEIIAFNSGTGQLTIQNNCNTGNASAGTNVPACTEFTVTVPPCDCGDSGQVCVAIDFTAPDNGDCIDITLTSIIGLQINDTVQIGTGFYRVSALKPNNIITICNDGEGLTPGTPVIAKNSGGQYQYCLQIIAGDPCSRDKESTLSVLGCNDAGAMVPYNESTDGWVLTTVDQNNNDSAFRPLGVYNTCTTLGADFIISGGIQNYTNILVASSANFTVGDVVQFEGIGSASGYFRITNIPNGTHISGSFLTVPVFPITLPAGRLVCPVSCCYEFEELNTIIGTNIQSPATTGTINNGTPTIDTPTQSLLIVNTVNNPLLIFFTIELQLVAGINGVNTAPLKEFSQSIYQNVNAVPVAAIASSADNFYAADNSTRNYKRNICASGTFTISALGSSTLQYFGRLSTVSIGVATIDVTSLAMKSSYIGVAL